MTLALWEQSIEWSSTIFVICLFQTYDKQNFHTGSTPQFGLTNNQNASVISGYGAPHLYIPTVPHQLHQPLHQDTANTSGQRTNSNLQNKPQTKSGYTGSYWTGSNW